MDRGVALYIKARINDVRFFVSKELERRDIPEGVRRELHEQHDALVTVSKFFGPGGRIKRAEKNLGEPEYLFVAEWDEESVEVYEVPESEFTERMDDLIEDGAVVTPYRVLKELGELQNIAIPQPAGSEEIVAEREAVIARRKETYAEHGYQERKFGKVPKFKVSGSRLAKGV